MQVAFIPLFYCLQASAPQQETPKSADGHHVCDHKYAPRHALRVALYRGAPWCSLPAPALRPSVATTSSHWKWRAQLCACYLKPPQVGSRCKLSLCLWSPLRYKQHASALSPKGAAFPPSDLGDKTTAAEHNNLPPSPSFPCPDTYLKPSSHRLIFLYSQRLHSACMTTQKTR